MSFTMTRTLHLLPLVLAATLSFGGCAKSTPAADTNAGKAFLAQNAKAADIHATASGLQYRILKSGPVTGAHPTGDGEVKVNYEGKLLDGTVFDSSYARGVPAVLSVEQLIPGWQEALKLMRPGDTWLVYLPPELSYGDQDAGPIPAGSVLVFKLELIAVGL
jgi:peptidylprolyl isomerase/FKBP-type peptidyl-prolyl cis-trans isomerase FklB